MRKEAEKKMAELLRLKLYLSPYKADGMINSVKSASALACIFFKFNPAQLS